MNKAKSLLDGDGIPSRFTHGSTEHRHLEKRLILGARHRALMRQRPLSFTIQTDPTATLRVPGPEIRHTTSARPTRMIRFHVRTREQAEDYDLWLDPGVTDPSRISDYLKPYAPKLMKKYPVGPQVNRAENDGAGGSNRERRADIILKLVTRALFKSWATFQWP